MPQGVKRDKVYTLADEIEEFITEVEAESGVNAVREVKRPVEARALRLLNRVLARTKECTEKHDHVSQKRCKIRYT